MAYLAEAVRYARATYMILPLIVFCFIPVWQDAKSTHPKLVLKVIAAFFCMELAMTLMYLLPSPAMADNINMVLCVVIFFYLYQKEIALARSHLWFVFITACMIGGVSFLFYHIVDIFLHPFGRIDTPVNVDSLCLQLAFEAVLVAALFYPAKKYLGWLVHHFHAERVWRVIWLIPFGFLVFSSVFIPYDNSVMAIGRFLQVYIGAVAVLSALIVAIYILFYKISYSIIENQRIIKRTANLEMQAQQYHKLQAYMQETSRLRHDFRYQLTVLAEMLKRKDYQELNEYLEQYIATVSDMPVRYCTSSAVNAILNHYAALCREQDITAHFQVRLLEAFAVEDIDFCVLLGNLLENAIDGCKPLPDEKRQITLKVGQTAEHVIVLQISNPYCGPLNLKEGRLYSSKHEGEGQGLKSVRIIAEKYNGYVDVQHAGDVFEVKVLLNF